MSEYLKCLQLGIPLDPLPKLKPRDITIQHAPIRNTGLLDKEEKLALKNALRYFPEKHHNILAGEFAQELRKYGHIYMYRFRPDIEMRAFPIQEYPARTQHGAAIMHMIMNNLDPNVAQFPHELVTYGGNGQVFSNWAQFWLTMYYLAEMDEDQTLVMYSGHPLGLFPSSVHGPRLVITNGMVVPNYSTRQAYDRMFALGVTMYGQMTAGSYCYIGPQGIVHGTTLTLLNAGRKYLNSENLTGKVFVTSGLGGMSGAQAKAAVICGSIGVIAEVSAKALQKRLAQGWLLEAYDDLDELIKRVRHLRKTGQSSSIGYLGNVVTLWERLVIEYESTGDRLVDLGSDQTSCHNPFNGGYYPVQVTFDEADKMMANDPEGFKNLVKESLCRQICAINKLTTCGMHFWDYGNAFLLEAHHAGADVGQPGNGSQIKFRYASYVQDIMGDIFSLGFGPFRWVCTSANTEDLQITDAIASDVLQQIIDEKQTSDFPGPVSDAVCNQFKDNIHWIKQAGKHDLVVGSQARILYSDQQGRTRISLAFNDAVNTGQLKGPVVISRDHHDVSGTDSPYRETANIYDGSSFTADMAVQNCIGDSFRGATWVALHNGGGVGWGEVINGGFGLVLDGTQEAARRARNMLSWDVSNGVARRCWSGNANADETIRRTMQLDPKLNVTLPSHVSDEAILDEAFSSVAN